jgi:hypothetical protein
LEYNATISNGLVSLDLIDDVLEVACEPGFLNIRLSKHPDERNRKAHQALRMYSTFANSEKKRKQDP